MYLEVDKFNTMVLVKSYEHDNGLLSGNSESLQEREAAAPPVDWRGRRMDKLEIRMLFQEGH